MKNIKKIYYHLFFIFLFSTIVYAQTHSLGFKVEPFIFLSKTEGTGTFAYKNKDEGGLYFSSIYLSYHRKLSETFSLNTVGGYLWTNEDRYNGIEIGELIKINIHNNSYFITGLSVHFNRERFIREFHVKNVIIPLFTLGTGLRFSRLFSAELQYQIPMNREYKTSGFNGPVYYRLYGLVKFSLGFEWEL